MSKPLPSQALLTSILRYEPNTGRLFWLTRPREHFPNSGIWQSWNERYAGREAFTTQTRGYRYGFVFGQGYRAHRIIWMMVYGTEPEFQIDHINGNPSDNRLGNLRLASNSQNSCNRGARATNKSGFKGVHFRPEINRWRAEITISGKKRRLGHFKSAQEAHRAYRDASAKYHGEFGRVS